MNRSQGAELRPDIVVAKAEVKKNLKQQITKQIPELGGDLNKHAGFWLNVIGGLKDGPFKNSPLQVIEEVLEEIKSKVATT
jgi:hypothetical protein